MGLKRAGKKTRMVEQIKTEDLAVVRACRRVLGQAAGPVTDAAGHPVHLVAHREPSDPGPTSVTTPARSMPKIVGGVTRAWAAAPARILMKALRVLWELAG
jgi:hypothetical protein